jgi:outer membrane protein
MKSKFVLRFICLLSIILTSAQLSAQRVSLAYIDSDYILGRMPEYKSAQQQLDDAAANWEAEAGNLEAKLSQMVKDFSAEEILLTSDQRGQRKEAITKQETELVKFREEKFGTDGELFKKRSQLIKPIQDKMFEAVQKVAKQEGLDYIFDKASGVQMLYANPKYDKTFEVMEELGIPLTENEAKPKGGAKAGGQN